METVYLNITLDPKKAKQRSKRKLPSILIRLYILVTLLLVLSVMLWSVAQKAADHSIQTSYHKVEVTEVNRKLGQYGNHEPEILIPLEASVAETDSLETAEFIATAYCGCEKCCGKWAKLRGDGPVTGAAGVPLIEGTSVAVDNHLYKFGTKFIDQDGNEYIAADTGGAIVGNRIDIYFEDHETACQFGRQTITLSWEG